MNPTSFIETLSSELTKEMNLSQEISNSSIQDQFSTITYLGSNIMNSPQTIPQHESIINQPKMKSKKQYTLKTCHFKDKRTEEIPFKKMFLTCLDFLIVESSAEMNQLSKNKFLSSFNYFKQVTNIERNSLKDWIRVNLSYVTMKKLPIKIMQQRLCNSKDLTGQQISASIQEDLLSYNRTFQNSKEGFKLIQPSKMEQNLKNKFCLYFEIEHSGNQFSEIERLIYDFHVKSICFSSRLSKFLAGDSLNLVNYISSKGVPEIYSSKTEYFDFWRKRLGSNRSKTIKSTLQSIDGYEFECEEIIRIYKHSENGQLIIQILFDFENGESTSNTNQTNLNLNLHSSQNIHKFLKSERQEMIAIIKSLKINLLSDPFVASVYEDIQNFSQNTYFQGNFQTFHQNIPHPQTSSLSQSDSMAVDIYHTNDLRMPAYNYQNPNQINLGVSTSLMGFDLL